MLKKILVIALILIASVAHAEPKKVWQPEIRVGLLSGVKQVSLKVSAPCVMINAGKGNILQKIPAGGSFIVDFNSLKVNAIEIRPENILLYANQGYGGLAGMFGVKYYIDSRSEVFLPENNGRKNILAEYFDFKSGKLNYKDFFARYKFTHIFITNADTFIFDELSADKNFRVIYESERVTGYSVVRCKIFVPKNEE